MADGEDSAGTPRGDTAIASARLLLDWWELQDRKFLPGRKRLSHEEERQAWLITVKLLVALADELDGGRKADGRALLRADPIRYAAGAIEEMVYGVIPLGLRPRKGARSGRTQAGTQRVGIGYARAYIQAVADGIIVDKAYNKTIREAYRVSDDAVQKWAKSPLGIQWHVLRMHVLRMESPEDRLEAGKAVLCQGAHLYWTAP